MRDDELDVMVAEQVMGWERVKAPTGQICTYPEGWETGNGYRCKLCQPPPAYTSESEADYEVLLLVRDKWNWELQRAFRNELLAILEPRSPLGLTPAMFYEPGDYSRAALKVING